MGKIYSLMVRAAMTMSALLAIQQSRAVIYTATSSGNFSNTVTWGGTVPIMIMSGDQVIIPAGLVVTLDTDLSLNGVLNLNSGTLVLNGHDLTFGTNSNLQVSGAGNIRSDLSSNITINSSAGLTGNLVFDPNHNVVNNLTINPGGANAWFSLGTDIVINGTLTIANGTLVLNGHDLTFASNSDFSSAGVGTIASSTGSDISFQNSNSFSGAVRFSNISNTIRNLVVNLTNSSNTVRIGTDVVVTGTLALSSGKLDVDGNELQIAMAGTLNGGSSASYVMTGNGGALAMPVAALSSSLFPVGTDSYYCPAIIANNALSSENNTSVGVRSGVYANGDGGVSVSAFQPVVDATWYLSSNSPNIDLDVQLMWQTAMEVNNFQRTEAFISQYSNGAWDATTTSAAMSHGGGYAMSRSNITQSGPLTITDAYSTLDIEKVTGRKSPVSLYPNPAGNVIRFTAPEEIMAAEVYDISGKRVKIGNVADNSLAIAELAPGYYTAILQGRNSSYTAQFIKSE
jgi:hypothetical protein